jgi:hypothetical protein
MDIADETDERIAGVGGRHLRPALKSTGRGIQINILRPLRGWVEASKPNPTRLKPGFGMILENSPGFLRVLRT